MSQGTIYKYKYYLKQFEQFMDGSASLLKTGDTTPLLMFRTMTAVSFLLLSAKVAKRTEMPGSHW